MNFTKVIPILFLVVFISSCDPEETPDYIVECKNDIGTISRSENTSYNILLLLDLSNRIEKNDQSKKDLELIESILNIFQNGQKEFSYQFSKDKLSVKICKQKNDETEFNIDKDNLVIDMNRDNSRNMNFPNFCRQRSNFIKSINDLYNYSLENKSYFGADIWNFFDEDIISLLQESTAEEKVKNKVVILTDGYLNFEERIEKKRPKGTYMRGYYKMRNKENWEKAFEDRNYKLKPHDHEFFDTEIIILEIDPKKPTEYTNEFSILSHYWKTWFKDMGMESNVYSRSKPVKDLVPLLKKDLFN